MSPVTPTGPFRFLSKCDAARGERRSEIARDSAARRWVGVGWGGGGVEWSVELRDSARSPVITWRGPRDL